MSFNLIENNLFEKDYELQRCLAELEIINKKSTIIKEKSDWKYKNIKTYNKYSKNNKEKDISDSNFDIFEKLEIIR